MKEILYTFTRPLAIPNDFSTALLKHSFTFAAIYAEEDYSILTKTSTKVFKSVKTNFFYFLLLPCLTTTMVFLKITCYFTSLKIAIAIAL